MFFILRKSNHGISVVLALILIKIKAQNRLTTTFKKDYNKNNSYKKSYVNRTNNSNTQTTGAHDNVSNTSIQKTHSTTKTNSNKKQRNLGHEVPKSTTF